MVYLGLILITIFFSFSPVIWGQKSELQKTLEQPEESSLETRSKFHPNSLRYLIETAYKNNGYTNKTQKTPVNYPPSNDFIGKVIFKNDPKLGGLPNTNADGLAKINEPPINFRYPPLNRNSQATTTIVSIKSTQSSLSTPSVNSTEQQESQDIRLYETIFKAFSYLFLGAIIISNLMVLTAYAKYHRLHTITNRFVISLAVADLCVGLSRSIQEIVEYIDPSDPAREIVTYRVQFFGTFPTTMNVASLLCLLGVTVDRYISVINPLRYTAIMTEKLANCIIIGAWCLAAFIIYLVPHFFIFWHGRNISHYYFLYRYILITYFILFVSLLFIISLFYARIFYACNKHQLMALFSKDFSARASSQTNTPLPPLKHNAQPSFDNGNENNSNKNNASLPPVHPNDNYSLGSGTNGRLIDSSYDSRNTIKEAEHEMSNNIGDGEGTRNSLTVPKKTSHAGSLGSELLTTVSPPLVPHGILKTTSSSLNNVHRISLNIGDKETSLSTDAKKSLKPQRTVSITDDRDEVIIPFIPEVPKNLANSKTSADFIDPSEIHRQSSETAPLTRRESAGVIIASKATIMIAMIVGTFATLGLPLQIMEYALIFKYDSIRNKVRFFIIHGICVLLYYSNSAVNPYIYAWKNRDFREAFKRILTCNRRINLFRDRAPTTSYFDDLPPPTNRKSRLASFFSSFDKTNHARIGSRKSRDQSQDNASIEGRPLTKRGESPVWKSRHS